MISMKKTHQYAPRSKERSQNYQNRSSSLVNTRNLRKDELGGVIFGCTHHSMEECLLNQIFGGPSSHFHYIQNIEPGLPLFLFNYSDRNMHGIFEAASRGQMNINPYGWTENGSERTRFPAQVHVSTWKHCDPLPEEMYIKIINGNYHTLDHFWFELDHTQAAQLIYLFESQSVNNPIDKISSNAPTPENSHTAAPSYNARQGNEDSTEEDLTSSNHVNVEPTCLQLESSSVDILKSDLDFDSRVKDQNLEFQDEGNKMRESQSDNGGVENEEDLVYLKLKQLSLNRDHSNSRVKGHKQDIVPRGIYLKDQYQSLTASVSQEKYESWYQSLTPSVSQEKHETWSVLKELIQEMEELKASKLEEIQRTTTLEEKLAESQTQVQELKDWVQLLQSRCIPFSGKHVDVSRWEGKKK